MPRPRKICELCGQVILPKFGVSEMMSNLDQRLNEIEKNQSLMKTQVNIMVDRLNELTDSDALRAGSIKALASDIFEFHGALSDSHKRIEALEVFVNFLNFLNEDIPPSILND